MRYSKFTVTRLDRRHKGQALFSHYITPVWSKHLEDKSRFFTWRTWCWDTWGPGIEREMALEFYKGPGYLPVGRWAWHTDDGAKRLYFQTDKELNWFVLTWGTE
jgi:hypothetical protein